ncbi:MAG: redoxin domain-containing protein [Deltaproteobacteria bacterium]|uniref:Redoxin domain-containing protein n=1 Tax=Candidatus Zymogenus saltonus TaxID=2844893 RepID=A0A9D8PMN2_9DELT|nr:redoxin domain-containing protein [Candidatus Zymogenus saltonus]
MSKLKTIAFFLLLVFLFSSTPPLWGKVNLKPGDSFPDIELKKPKGSEDKKYLGLKGWGGFTIGDIGAEVVIIELFSMYCSHCQNEAPLTRKLYEIIEADRRLKGRFKIIGIGINNSDFEVNFFKEKYKIPFPLVSDDENMVEKTVGKVLTPHYVVVRITGDGRTRVIFSEAGRLEDPKVFLDMIYKLEFSGGK